MATESETPTVAVISVDGGEPHLLVEESAAELDGVEVEAGSASESDEVSDAVAIAEIEANAEITIAALQTDVAIAQIEAATEIETARIDDESERENSWQNRAEMLEANMRELTDQVQTLLSGLASDPSTPTAQPDLTEVAAEVAEEVAEEVATTSTPAFMSPPIVETQTEVILSDADEKPVATAEVKTRVKRRLI